MAANNIPNESKRRHYLAALVLGTALTTISAPAVMGCETEPTGKAVTDISKYCTACWRNARLPVDCWSDCTQEVFSRLVQTINPSNWGQVFSPEGAARLEFLRAIDAVKKRTQRQLKRTGYLNTIVPDYGHQVALEKLDDFETVQAAAGEVLSERQQQIIRMSLEGWAVQEIADTLAIAPERVSDEKYKAIRKLRQHLQVD